MVEMIGLLREINCGIDAGKLLEIMDKMRLIKIPAACRHIRPGKVETSLNNLQYVLETLHTGKELRCKSNFFGKKLNESARTDADVASKVSDGRSCMNIAEKTQGEIDRAMPLQRTERLRQEAFFHDLKFRCRRWRFQQAFPQQPCRVAPQVLQRDVEIVQFTGRHSKERKRTAWLEMNADDRVLLGGIDYKEAGMRAADQSSREPLTFVQILAVVNPRFVFFEVDD